MQKWLAGRKNGNRIFIENEVSVSKNSKDGKWENWYSFKNQKLENHLKTGLGNYF